MSFFAVGFSRVQGLVSFFAVGFSLQGVSARFGVVAAAAALRDAL